jgi:hypothetical protein
MDKRSKEYRESQVRGKQNRVPPGQPRMKLIVEGLQEGHRGYWAKKDQFDDLKNGGYTFVNREGIEVGTTGEGNTDLGSIVSQSDGSSGDRLYLMEIREDWYQENEAIKQKEITETEEQILNPESENRYAVEGNKISHGKL